MKPFYSGKVRDLYELNGDLMMVATDRISAYDVILQSELPKKGIILNKLSRFHFKKYNYVLKKHGIKCPIVVDAEIPIEFENRAIVMKKCKPLPIEAIVRGYLFGSAVVEYNESSTICGITIPKGLQIASQLDKPLFTPSTKAAIGDHDINISFDKMISICGKEIATKIRDFSLDLFQIASKDILECGIILCDTKLEFGLLNDELYLIDEVLTPDSSRYWSKDHYKVGISPPSFDKQFIRDYLTMNNLKGQPAILPQDIIDKTLAKYIECYEKVTASKFDF